MRLLINLLEVRRGWLGMERWGNLDMRRPITREEAAKLFKEFYEYMMAYLDMLEAYERLNRFDNKFKKIFEEV